MHPAPHKTFKAISLLLQYPEETWMHHIAELETCLLQSVKQNSSLYDEVCHEMASSFIYFKSNELIDCQEQYVSIFDRGRASSLHLFEHIHGESRDRGQAMIDLIQHYKSRGFEINQSELPDFLPLFLEFLSQIPGPEALSLLKETGHIIGKITGYHVKQKTPYLPFFKILCDLAGTEPLIIEGRASLDPTDLDKNWEEKPVDFLGAKPPYGSSCATGGCGKKP